MSIKLNSIEERLLELNCGIINILDNQIEIHGFLSEARLDDYLNGKNCRYSHGIYSLLDFDESIIQDNSLFIIQNNRVESHRVQFITIYDCTRTIKIKGKDYNRKIKIRRDVYSDVFQLIIEREHLNFNSLILLDEYFKKNYDSDLKLSDEACLL